MSVVASSDNNYMRFQNMEHDRLVQTCYEQYNQIKSLKAQLEEYQGIDRVRLLDHADKNNRIKDLTKKLKDANQDAESMEKYSRHHHYCDILDFGDSCNCGFEEALKLHQERVKADSIFSANAERDNFNERISEK